MYKQVNRVLVGDGAQSGTVTHLSGIKKGDLVLIRENGTIVNTDTASAAIPKFEKVTIAAGIADGIAILSSPIQGNTVSKYEGAAYVAPTEMVLYLGYNGTASTTIATGALTEYRLRILNKDANRINGQRQTLVDVNYKSDASEGELSVLTKMANLYYAKDLGHNYFGDKVKLEIVSDGTFVASDNTLAVVKGSDKATFATAATYDTGTAFAVGDLVRIGGTTAASPVYTITAVDTLEVTLSTPYQGATETVAAASVGHLATPAEFGFKLTGIAQTSKVQRNANEPFDQYEWILFDAAFTDANDMSSSQYSATQTVAVKAKPGTGFWKQVADAEEAAKGYFGDSSKRRWFDQRIDSNVVAGTTYSSIVITHADVHGGNFQDNETTPLRTEIYIPYNTAQGDSTEDNFRDVMNGYFNTVLGFTAIAAF